METNIDFLKDLSSHPQFHDGDVHTGFIEENFDSLFPILHVPSEVLVQGTLAVILNEELEAMKKALNSEDPLSPFATETGFRINHILAKKFKFLVGNEEFVIDVQYTEPDVYLIRVNDLGPWRKVTGSLKKMNKTLELNTEIDGVAEIVKIANLGSEIVLFGKVRHLLPHPMKENYSNFC